MGRASARSVVDLNAVPVADHQPVTLLLRAGPGNPGYAGADARVIDARFSTCPDMAVARWSAICAASARMSTVGVYGG